MDASKVICPTSNRERSIDHFQIEEPCFKPRAEKHEF